MKTLLFFVGGSPQDDTVTRRVIQVSVCAKSTTGKLRLPTNEAALHAPLHLPWVQRLNRRVLSHHFSTSKLTEFLSPFHAGEPIIPISPKHRKKCHISGGPQAKAQIAREALRAASHSYTGSGSFVSYRRYMRTEAVGVSASQVVLRFGSLPAMSRLTSYGIRLRTCHQRHGMQDRYKTCRPSVPASSNTSDDLCFVDGSVYL